MLVVNLGGGAGSSPRARIGQSRFSKLAVFGQLCWLYVSYSDWLLTPS